MGGPLDLGAAKGKVALVENVAGLGATVKDYLQMNELVDKFGSEDFTILAFPCNQFTASRRTPTSRRFPC